MSYTPQTAGEMLDLPPSTLRRYASDYADFMSASAKAGIKKRRYTDQDIIILRKIKELTRARKTTDEIRAAIRVIDKDQAAPGSSLAMLPDVLQEFETLRSQLARMESQKADRGEIAELKERLARLEEYYRLPLLKRIFRRPPE